MKPKGAGESLAEMSADAPSFAARLQSIRMRGGGLEVTETEMERFRELRSIFRWSYNIDLSLILNASSTQTKLPQPPSEASLGSTILYFNL
jgi:hypothetical protein